MKITNEFVFAFLANVSDYSLLIDLKCLYFTVNGKSVKTFLINFPIGRYHLIIRSLTIFVSCHRFVVLEITASPISKDLINRLWTRVTSRMSQTADMPVLSVRKLILGISQTISVVLSNNVPMQS